MFFKWYIAHILIMIYYFNIPCAEQTKPCLLRNHFLIKISTINFNLIVHRLT